MDDFKFSDLKVSPADGNPIVGAAELTAIQKLMAEAGQSADRVVHEMVGQGMREPIRQMAEYREWTSLFFAPWAVGYTEDNRIPLDEYIAIAFYTHPDAQVMPVRPGLKWTRPEFKMIDTAIEIGWDVILAAGWPVLRRKMQEAAEELARKRDEMGLAVLDAAVVSLAGHTDTVATAIDKTSIDGIFQAAATIGFPIKTVAINSGTVMAMSGWTGSSFGMQHLTDAMIQQLVVKGFIGEYGGANWYTHHSVPVDYVYFGGSPDAIGYHQTMGGTRAASDVDIFKKTDVHTLDEKHAYYIGNAYNLWRLQIT